MDDVNLGILGQGSRKTRRSGVQICHSTQTAYSGRITNQKTVDEDNRYNVWMKAMS
jgi:hypothetical protein